MSFSNINSNPLLSHKIKFESHLMLIPVTDESDDSIQLVIAGIIIISRFVTRVAIAASEVLSVREEINKPSAIRVAPKSSIPRSI